MEKLKLDVRPADLSEWRGVVEAKANPEAEVTIAMVGKYVDLKDSYMSLTEALRHAGIRTRTRVNINYFDSEDIQTQGTACLNDVDAILVPGGFGERGIEGKIAAVKFAREKQVPYLRYLPRVASGRDRVRAQRRRAARRALDGAQRANAASRDRDDHGVARPRRHDEGAQRSLGARRHDAARRPSLLRARTARSRKRSTAPSEISERHRHRYEFNNRYKDQLSKAGLVFSGFSQRRARRAHRVAARHASVVLRARSFTPSSRRTRATAIRCSRASSMPRALVPRTQAPASRERMRLAEAEVGQQAPLFLIAGPCVIESEALVLSTAERLKADHREARRCRSCSRRRSTRPTASSLRSFRGLGIERGLRMLERVRTELGVPVLTDVHEDTPLDEVAAVVDVLQTPALLCRQTDFISPSRARANP